MGTAACITFVTMILAACILSLTGIMTFHNGTHRAAVMIDKAQLIACARHVGDFVQRWTVSASLWVNRKFQNGCRRSRLQRERFRHRVVALRRN